jgi:hypothetical protein
LLDSITAMVSKAISHLQAPARKKDLKVSKEAAPSKPIAEVPVSPVPPKTKNGGPDEFALVSNQAARNTGCRNALNLVQN